MKNNGFIKNLDLLEETCKVDDLLDFSDEENKLRIKLDGADRNSVFGLVAPFGSGKSTLLENMVRNAEQDELWINFDAWKFPDRKEMWQGFILEVAEVLGRKKAILKKIDGKETKSKIVDVATDVLGAISESLSGFNLLDKFIGIFKTSPATRVFEIQEIFRKLITGINKKYSKIYFIVEDIDRSGDKGIFFLETLKYFLAENNFDGKIVHAIVPIATHNYNSEDANISYRKVLDYVKILSLEQVDYSEFIENIFDQSFFNLFGKDDKWIPHFNFLFKNICKEYNLTIRDLKHVLRNANTHFTSLDEELKKKINVRLFILFSFLKYLEINNKLKSGKSHYIHNINHQFRFNDRLTWARHYMSKVINNLGEEMIVSVDAMIIFKEISGYEAKYFGDGSWFLSDFYKDLNVF